MGCLASACRLTLWFEMIIVSFFPPPPTVYSSITAVSLLLTEFQFLLSVCNAATLIWEWLVSSWKNKRFFYFPNKIKVGFKTCLRHAAVQFCLLSLVRPESTTSSLMLLQSIHSHTPWLEASIFIHKSCRSQRGPGWVVCSLEIEKSSFWLEGHKSESQ